MKIIDKKKDVLAKRERFIYGLLHKAGIIWTFAAMYWYFFIFESELNFFGVLILVLPCALVSVFGWALRFDIRLINGLNREDKSQ